MKSRKNESLFSSKNPLVGLSAEDQFEKVQWGNKAKRVVELDVKHLKTHQEMVMMGRFRAMHVKLPDGEIVEIVAHRPYPYLAFGAKDNVLWLMGGSLDQMAKNLKFGYPGIRGDIIRTDYESTKGESSGKKYYYYHDHKHPFAKLKVHRDGYPEYVGGGYSVRPEGIVR